MSVVSGVSNKTTGLVLHIDAYNTNKSWKGQPITNQFPLPTPAANGDVSFPANGTGTFQRIYSGTYGGYDILGTDVVYKYVLGTLGCHYHGITFASIPAGTTVTFSVDYYIDPSVTGYPETNYIGNMEGVLSNSFTDPTPGTVGVWKRGVITTTAGSTGSANALLYPGACGNTRLASGGFILYKNPQVEYASFASNFSASGRTNTQSIIDLTGNNTVTVNSLTYNSDNTFSFNGSNNYISVASSSNTNPGSGSFTIQGWMYITGASASGWHMLVANRGQGGTGGYYVGLNDTTGGNFMLTNDAGGRTDTSTTGTPTWAYNKWVMVTAILDRAANTQTLIINDNAQSFAITPSGGNYANTSPLNIGGDAGSGSYYTNGKIANLKVYNRALSIAEVKDNFNALKSKFGL